MLIYSQAASFRSSNIQVGQLADELRNRPQGSLPSDTINLRQGKEQCKTNLRSGKVLDAPILVEEEKKAKPSSILKGNAIWE